MSSWSVVIGIEIHAHILSQSKMFSSDSSQFSLKENEHIHPVSLGFPGTLPVLNEQVVKSALKIGQAFNCDIQKKSIFARKNYFYPDLPKGYQISQYDQPLLKNGSVEFYYENQICKINLERIHLEEDAGRLLHQQNSSFVDFNRSGMPLLEIVSQPDLTSPKQAAEYSRMVRNVLVYLEVCDGNLQEGSMRFDCNISLRKSPQDKLGTKVELKNLNSFRFMEKALNFEIKRQSEILNTQGKIMQETRLFNPKKGETFSMREKEEASDYRYFPEPDLPPLIVQIPEKKLSLELPFQKTKRLHEKYKIPLDVISLLVEDVHLCSYFEKALEKTQATLLLSKWLTNEVLATLKENKVSIQDIPISAGELAELINQIENKTLSSKMAKDVFSQMWKTGQSVQDLIQKMNLKKITDPIKINELIDQVFQSFPEQCLQYKQGKTSIYKFLMGQLMKLSKGQVDPVQSDTLLKEKLKSL